MSSSFFKFFIWAASPVQHLARRSQGQERVLRVPPDEYRSVLKAFIKEIRAAGAIPLLITAPRRSLTSAVVGKRYVVSIEEGNRTHDQYIDITRKVAQETGAIQIIAPWLTLDGLKIIWELNQ